MRWIIAVIGALCLTVGGAVLMTTLREQKDDSRNNAIRQALKGSAAAIAAETIETLERQEAAILALLEGHLAKRNGPKTMLESTGPSILLYRSGSETRELVNKEDTIPEGLKVILQATLSRPFNTLTRLQLWEDSAKRPYLILRGQAKSSNKFDFIAMYPMDRLLGKLRTAAAMRPWVSLLDGRLLFHTSPRLIGMSSLNIKPVAQGATSLRQRNVSLGIDNYVSFDGKEALGAWQTVPEWGITFGAEWPQALTPRNSVQWLTFVALGALLLGALIVGFSLTPRPVQVLAAQREIKDLSHEARSFIKRAEKQAEEALAFARRRDQEAGDLEAQARERLAYAERIRWIFEKTEAFFEEAIEVKHEREIWELLANYLGSMALNVPVLVYSYSTSSCSLMPQAQSGLEAYPEGARRYLRESRMLVGDVQALAQLSENSAFQTWRERWARFMPTNDLNIFSLPFASPTGARGVVCFLFSQGMMDDAEIAKQRDLWELFAYRAGWLYDLKKRLLQSKNGNARKSSVASAHDKLRDRPAEA